jgi:hypothetical protein
VQAEGSPHPCNEAERNGKGVAQRRSAQAKRGRLGKRLVGARGGAPERTEYLRYKTDQRPALHRPGTLMVLELWSYAR